MICLGSLKMSEGLLRNRIQSFNFNSLSFLLPLSKNYLIPTGKDSPVEELLGMYHVVLTGKIPNTDSYVNGTGPDVARWRDFCSSFYTFQHCLNILS